MSCNHELKITHQILGWFKVSMAPLRSGGQTGVKLLASVDEHGFAMGGGPLQHWALCQQWVAFLTLS